MDQRQVVFITVAAAVALGGIYLAFAGLPEPFEEQQPDPAPEGTPTLATPGGSAEATPASEPTSNDGQKYYQFDGDAFNETHSARLAAVGNFTSRSNLTVRGAGSHDHYNVTYAVDLQERTQYSAIDFRDERDDGDTYPLVRTYESGDTTHVNRTQEGRDPACDVYRAPYDDGDRPVNTSLALDVGEIATGVIDRSNWTYGGNETQDGVALYRFGVSETRNFGTRMRGNVTDGEATMVVGGDGVLRYITYDFTLERGGSEVRYVYRSVFTNVGSTRVAQPDWYPC